MSPFLYQKPSDRILYEYIKGNLYTLKDNIELKLEENQFFIRPSRTQPNCLTITYKSDKINHIQFYLDENKKLFRGCNQSVRGFNTLKEALKFHTGVDFQNVTLKYIDINKLKGKEFDIPAAHVYDIYILATTKKVGEVLYEVPQTTGPGSGGSRKSKHSKKTKKITRKSTKTNKIKKKNKKTKKKNLI